MVRQRRNATNPASAAPSRFFLLYVRTPDDESMLSLFDFFALPVPLDEYIVLYNDSGQWHHHPATAFERAQRVVQAINNGGYGARELAARLLLEAKPTALLLPPQNFRMETGRPLGDEMRRLRTQGDVNALLSLDDSIKTLRFEKRQLPYCPQMRKGVKGAFHQVA